MPPEKVDVPYTRMSFWPAAMVPALLMPPANTAPVIDIPTRGGSADRARGIDLDPGADKAGIENLAIDAAVGDRQGAGDRPGIADVAGEGRTGNVDRRSDAGIGVRERSGIGHDKPPARVEWSPDTKVNRARRSVYLLFSNILPAPQPRIDTRSRRGRDSTIARY